MAANFNKDAASGDTLIYPSHWTESGQSADAGGASPVEIVEDLSVDQLAPIVDEAIARIASVEGDQAASALRSVTYAVVDLPGNELARTVGSSRIEIDIDAVGHGWFVDSTPGDDVEFALPTGFQQQTALPGTPAHGRADLLTAVMHEMGHLLGYDHEDEGVMPETLPLGTRRGWNDGSLLDGATDASAILEESGPTVAVVDDYFATT
jgi:hypothetical protein